MKRAGAARGARARARVRCFTRTVAFGCYLPIAGLVACSDAATEAAKTTPRSLQLDPDFEGDSPDARSLPASDYTLFEADPVRPLAVLAASGLVAVANTADDALDLARPTERGVRACGSIRVGMRPVAVAVVRESRREAELWVVNHLSDSVSVVRLDPETCSGAVTDTLFTGDEPRDIVVAPTRAGEQRVFVTCAHRGQHHPLPAARSGADLVTPPRQKAHDGLADVLVYNPSDTATAPAVINLFSDTPRALALGDGVVYAAGFRTGNRTSVLNAELAAARGVQALEGLLATDAEGQLLESDGELVLKAEAVGVARMAGGMPAVAGSGRCIPDPRPELSSRNLQQVCVATDAEQRVQRVVVQREGAVHASCQCTSGDGTLQPTSGVLVKFFERVQDCGQDFTTFPDGTSGCWLDADPAGVRSPAARSGEQAPPMAWNDDVKLSLPDLDVFAIGVEELAVRSSFAGVGTVLFNMAVQPGSGRVFVTNTEAQNLTRFEGPGTSSSSTVRGHLHESRITVIDPRRGRVQPVHLNSHVDYASCCAREPGKNEASFAFPTAAVFSPDGAQLYFAALGSDEVGVVQARALGPGFDNTAARRRGELSEIALGSGGANSGPVGLALDARRKRLYVKTHISNELLVIDTERRRVSARLGLHTPEPESITAGREVFYDARGTSAHGDSSCASCHVFGDFDGLSWDLGNPDEGTVRNPGPFIVATEVVAAAGLASDPLGEAIGNRPLNPDFRSNKGPMNTQTLRGMANHGAQHWRGDRTRNFQDLSGAQPNFGSLDENNSFNEFDVAIEGLNGNDAPLAPELFQRFTDFALQLTLPPNPVRALDDSLDAAQARARALFFGCSSMSDQQYERRQCIDQRGTLVDIDAATRACTCANNPLVSALHETPAVSGLGQLLQLLLSDPALRQGLLEEALNPAQLSAEAVEQLPARRDALAASADGLLALDLSLRAKGLFSPSAAQGLSRFIGSLLAIVQLPRQAPGRSLLVDVLFAALPEGAPFASAAELAGALESGFALSNLAARAALDEAARGGAGFHDLLNGCDPSAAVPQCSLRATDQLQTCHGCHTLDPRGNAEFEVFRPGFFGTSGEYSFENEPQVLKVPHLRNQYQKVGMFGMQNIPLTLGESVLGPARGGFLSDDAGHQGPQVRGFGFLHDGAIDTLERFHSGLVFVAQRDNPSGFEAVLPRTQTRDACVRQLRAGSPDVLGPLAPELREALSFCAGGSGVPDICFSEPRAAACSSELTAIGAALGRPDFERTFAEQILPACFQFGSMLEQGLPGGVCAPAGLRERLEMESFMLAFDSNLKPMVGQQLTLRSGRDDAAALQRLLRAAARGHCDLALRQENSGLLVTRPDAERPERSQLQRPSGARTTLGALRRDTAPITLTCYPPQNRRAEARRAAFGGAKHR